MEYLGVDILMEILSRLDVEDLIRLKSVSKTFLDLISSHHFVRLHLNKSSLMAINLNKHHSICLKRHGEEEVESSLRVIHVYKHGEKVDKFTTISYGSCNGLVFLWPRYYNNKYASGVLLWNPALREAEFVPIKRPTVGGFGLCFCWFGYDNDEYKLILGVDSHIHLIRLYIDTNAWKSSLKIDGIYRFIEDIGTLVHRTVHWPAWRKKNCTLKDTIISYDLSNETVGRIATPDGLIEPSSFKLGQVDGCLSSMIAQHNHVELWVMKEYGVEESWTKLMILPLPFRILQAYREPYGVKFKSDDPAQISSIYDKRFYVGSLISPRSIRTKMC